MIEKTRRTEIKPPEKAKPKHKKWDQLKNR